MYIIEKNNESVVKVAIKLDGEEFKKIRQEIMAKYKDAKIDGFRKGHVPMDIIEKEFAGNIRQDLYDTVVNKEFSKALVESNEEPISRLEVIEEKITKESLEVVLKFDAMPSFEMPEYKGLDVEFTKAEEVKDEDVNATLESIAKRSAEKVVSEKEVIENNDIANINFEGFVDGVAFEGGKAEGFDLLLGSHQFIDNFEDQIVGHKVGDEFEVNVTFPAEYHSENLKGKKAMFKVKLNSIKEEKVAEINDELAKKNGEESLEALKNSIKEGLQKEREERVSVENFQKVADKLVSMVEMTVPEKVKQEEADREVNEFKNQLAQYGQNFDEFIKRTGKTMEEFNADALERAEKTVKFRLIASRIIKEENLTVSNADIDASLSEMAGQYGMSLVQLKEELNKMNLLDQYSNDIANRLVTEKLRKVLLEK
ncbi:trigger factor [Oceanivirga miroungae]|uniref:Trigger factor n=1 Tax=Oceanivirga miroungae TaxID=1130046 RepID=A0A6I8MDZ1_9FUSO|nr:trigger factor [Oceanivirga miroungae]VWL85311.1 trigger factor [Oceanivirga miroungae]